MKVTLLGCGTSSGVPRIDGDWGKCDPLDPRNRRRRASILVEHSGTRILVDTTPDLREQLLAEGGRRPTAVIWTHEHADHCHGIDDLRPFYFYGREPIVGFARERTRDELVFRFKFAFVGHGGYPPFVECDLLGDDVIIGGVRVRATELPHGRITSTALRFDVDGKSVAYLTDFNALPDEAAKLIEAVDVLIMDGLRREPHPSHPHLAQSLAWIAASNARQAVLTHMDQSMDYTTVARELPFGVVPGFDGMVLTP